MKKNNIQPQNSIPDFFIYIMYIIILYIVDLGTRFYIELKFINFYLLTQTTHSLIQWTSTKVVKLNLYSLYKYFLITRTEVSLVTFFCVIYM